MSAEIIFKNHRLVNHSFWPAKWTGGEITPELIVLHDTAGRLDEHNSAMYLQDNDAKVSVHFVIERNGEVIQQVATNKRANHAGNSSYHGRRNCNNFSIGIELVNTGRMTRMSDHIARTWYGQSFIIASALVDFDHDPQLASQASSTNTLPIREMTTPEHGSGLWLDYTKEQLEACIDLCRALFLAVPTLKDIRGHWYVSPGRKSDPNPLFPMEQLRSLILGREEPEPVTTDEIAMSENDLVEIETRGDSLNMRRWPSYNPNVILGIPDGTIVPVIRRGVFNGEAWELVRYGGHEGWVNSRYTAETMMSGVVA